MAKIIVRNQTIKTLTKDEVDYICITDIARQKNPAEPKDVVKNWLRSKNTLEYLGLWEQLNNPNFKGVEFDPLLKEACSNLGFQPVSILLLEYFFQNFLPKSLAVSKRNRNFVVWYIATSIIVKR